MSHQSQHVETQASSTLVFTASTETDMEALHAVWLKQCGHIAECMAALEHSSGAVFDEAIDPILTAKWATETQILAMQPETATHARIQLTVLLAAYNECEYEPKVFDRVIKSAIRVIE